MNNSFTCEYIALKSGIENDFGPMSSESKIQLQFDVNLTSVWRHKYVSYLLVQPDFKSSGKIYIGLMVLS